MNTVKYRAWDIEEKVFLPDWAIHLEGDGSIHGHVFIGGDDEDVLLYSPEYREMRPDAAVIQLFTGLKDKNDKEIYEGDIIFWKVNPPESPIKESSYGRIVYLESEARFGLCMPEYKLTYTLGGAIMKENLTVAGNIFENPELCKEN